VAVGGERVWITVAAALVVAAGFVAAYQFVEPAPPRHLVLAAGPEDGAYWRFAQRYRVALARSGIDLEVRATAGSIENLSLLEDEAAGVAVAFVQGGLLGDAPRQGLAGLGTLFVEPIWIFTALDPPPDRLDRLRGLKIAVGAERSGTRALALQLLGASGIDGTSARLEAVGGQAAADALIAGALDIVFLVTAATSPVVRRLAAAPGLELVTLQRAEAYAQVYPFLERVVLHEGALDFALGVPGRDTELLAAKASLVARDTLHPALLDMLMVTLREVHGGGDLFSPPGRFPSPHGLDVPLAPEAARFHERGPPFLLRYLPFWTATLLDRAAIMILPFVTLLVPLARVVPWLFDRRLKSRVWRWYAELAAVERAAADGELARARSNLLRVEREVCQLRLPTSHAHLAYQLRQHLELVRQRLVEREASQEPPDAVSGLDPTGQRSVTPPAAT
jgi:TRAP-type uncharacterized transport system substrate-binding protein